MEPGKIDRVPLIEVELRFPIQCLSRPGAQVGRYEVGRLDFERRIGIALALLLTK